MSALPMDLASMADLNPASVAYVFLHTEGAPRGSHGTAAGINRYHREKKGWSGIGYHLVILRDGTVEEGRPLTKRALRARVLHRERRRSPADPGAGSRRGGPDRGGGGARERSRMPPVGAVIFSPADPAPLPPTLAGWARPPRSPAARPDPDVPLPAFVRQQLA